MADFQDVVKSLKNNKESQDAGFKRVEDAVLSGTRENKGAVEETKKKEKSARKKELTLFGEIASGIKAMNKTLMDGLKKLGEKGLGGLGMIAALVAGPFIMLAAFFKQIAMELAFLKNLSKGKVISKIFAPIKLFFSSLGKFTKLLAQDKALMSLAKINMKPFTMIAKLFTAMGKDIKPLGASVVKNVKAGIAAVSKFITPVVNFFKSIIGAAKSSASFMTGFKPVMKFFATIGKTLGKFFLPITFLMAAFDAVTGFMDGYDEGGILGGIEGAVTKVFNGLVSAPLDLLKSAVSWILGKLGFEEAESTLDSFSFKDFFTKIFGAIFDGIDGAVSFIKELFTFPADGGPIAAIGKLVDILFLPLNLAINFIKGLFGFEEKDAEGNVEPFSIGKFITDMITKVVDYIKNIFPSFDDLKSMLPSAGDLLSKLNPFSSSESDADKEMGETIKKLEKDATAALEKAEIFKRAFEEAVFMGAPREEKRKIQGEADSYMQDYFDIKREIKSLQKREMGGPVARAIPYVVGEKGPELFIPKSDGMIKNEQQTNQMMQSAAGRGNGGGTTIVNAPSVKTNNNTSNSNVSTSSNVGNPDPTIQFAFT
tara:strand:+ start:25 stop:1815 length:1791 start_codon:yes stop_codon:yes gene_type:complete